MTNKLEFEIALLKADITKTKLAKILGITEAGLYLKLSNQTEFKASEIAKLSKALNLSVEEQQKIFFGQEMDLKS